MVTTSYAWFVYSSQRKILPTSILVITQTIVDEYTRHNAKYRRSFATNILVDNVLRYDEYTRREQLTGQSVSGLAGKKSVRRVSGNGWLQNVIRKSYARWRNPCTPIFVNSSC